MHALEFVEQRPPNSWHHGSADRRRRSGEPLPDAVGRAPRHRPRRPHTRPDRSEGKPRLTTMTRAGADAHDVIHRGPHQVHASAPYGTHTPGGKCVLLEQVVRPHGRTGHIRKAIEDAAAAALFRRSPTARDRGRSHGHGRTVAPSRSPSPHSPTAPAPRTPPARE